jgi:hypothetical protein
LIIDAALTIYRGLLSGIPDYQRDVSYCRTRLESLAQAIGPHIRSKQENEPAEYILPVGCDNLEAAADQFIALLPPEDLLRFDGEFQEVIKKKFKGLTTLCLEPEKAVGFTELFLEHGRAFIDSRLEHADPAEALSNYRGDGQDCLDLLTQAFEKAAPLISLVEPRQHLEGSILAVPPGTSGEHLRDLVNVANPGIEFIPAESPDELVFYRELPLVPISELKVMGTAGSEAYLAQHNSNAPPHARVDIKWIAPMKPATPR